MIDPEDVTSAELALYDAMLDHLLQARNIAAIFRARQYTRDYDRMRKQAIMAARQAPTPIGTQSDGVSLSRHTA